MKTVLLCLALLLLLPNLLAALGSYTRKRQLGRVNNHDPRQQVLQLDSRGQRLYAAQQNAWEALLLFSGCVLLAHLAGLDLASLKLACIVFITSRLLHPLAYVYGFATLRSLLMLVAWLSCIYIVSAGLLVV